MEVLSCVKDAAGIMKESKHTGGRKKKKTVASLTTLLLISSLHLQPPSAVTSQHQGGEVKHCVTVSYLLLAATALMC